MLWRWLRGIAEFEIPHQIELMAPASTHDLQHNAKLRPGGFGKHNHGSSVDYFPRETLS